MTSFNENERRNVRVSLSDVEQTKKNDDFRWKIFESDIESDKESSLGQSEHGKLEEMKQTLNSIICTTVSSYVKKREWGYKLT